MRIGIFANEKDPIANRIEQITRARGATVLRIDWQKMIDGRPTAFDGEHWLLEQLEINSCDSFLIRQFPAPTPILSADPKEMISAHHSWQRTLHQTERSQFAQSCLMDLEQNGKKVINPLLASAPFDFKPLQLATFRRAGLPIPQTVITNAPAVVTAFRDQLGAIIAKPLSGGALTEVVDDRWMRRLPAVQKAPAIFQELVAGTNIRVTVVGQRVVSAVEIPTTDLDYRRSRTYQEGEQDYRPHELPSPVVDQCLRAAELCHQVLSGIDLRRRDNGNYVFIEANSAPVYLDIERKTGAPISEAVVDELLR